MMNIPNSQSYKFILCFCLLLLDFDFNLIFKSQAQTLLITPSNPYSQNWDSTTLANDGWSINATGDRPATESLADRNGGNALQIGADFSGTRVGEVEVNLDSALSVGDDYGLSDIVVEMDLFMNERGERVTFSMSNGGGSEYRRWHFSNDAPNMWQTHSFTLDSDSPGDRIDGTAFDVSADFQMQLFMDGSWWGDGLDGQIMRIDNFSVSVPESSISFLAALSLCLLAILQTRQTQHEARKSAPQLFHKKATYMTKEELKEALRDRG